MSPSPEATPRSLKRVLAVGLGILAIVAVLAWRGFRTERELAPDQPTPTADDSAVLDSPAAELEVGDEALHRERAEVSEEVGVVPAEPPPEAPPLTCRLTGTVTNAAGEVVDDAWVSLWLPNGERTNASKKDDGEFTLSGFPLGSHLISVTSRRYHDGSVTLVFDEAHRERRHDFVLREKQRIRVRAVTSSGEPAIPALKKEGLVSPAWRILPIATKERLGATYTGVRGSPNNVFGIGQFWGTRSWQDLSPPTDDELGTITLQQEGPCWISLVAAQCVLGQQQVDPSTEVVTFTLDPADILALRAGVRGVLVDKLSRAPVSGGTISLADDPIPNGPYFASADDGAFSIEASPPGERYLSVRADGYAWLVLPVHLKPGEVLDLGEVGLGLPVTLSGKAVNAAGEPVVAVLEWGRIDEQTGVVSWIKQVRAVSDEEGEFTIVGLEPGLWAVRSPGLKARPPRPFEASMASLTQRVDARNGSVEDLEVVLHETSNLMLVAENVTEPWPRAEAFDSAGLPARAADIGRWGIETPLRLPPGNYVLVVERGGVEIERRSIAVNAEPQSLEFHFE